MALSNTCSRLFDKEVLRSAAKPGTSCERLLDLSMYASCSCDKNKNLMIEATQLKYA